MAGLRLCFQLLIYLSFSTLILSQTERAASPCKTAKTCGQCMQAGPECNWCAQEDFVYDRCDENNALVSGRCEHIVNELSNMTFNRNEPVRDGSSGTATIQLSPQEITLDIRPNEPYEFNVVFRQAENYPVDLYYLMDLSNSMEDDKNKLAELGGLIADEMNKITKNFFLGFGSFVDKETMPYVSTVPKKLRNPCGEGKACDPPYSFRNRLKLGDNKDEFARQVLESRVSGNLDSPEGGFDALMQAIVCKNQIGWRDNSRKIVMFSTDAGFHYAGDGLLGGIVIPNDGKCHMDTDNFYDFSLKQDYPSISQIASVASDHNVNVIFAVTKDQLKTYGMLTDFLSGSTHGELANDSSNIVKLVRENYEKITSMVELVSDASEDFTVTFKSPCKGLQVKDTNTCSGLKIGEQVNFTVSVTANRCTSAGSNIKTVKIKPVGLNDVLTIKLNLICNCGCEDALLEERNSPKCNGTGTYECGACTCPADRYGSFCQCDATSINNKDFESSCRRDNTSDVCSGHGSCVCGTCECNPVDGGNGGHLYEGKFCDCNNYNCPYSHGQPCGGPMRGKCQCSKCTCNKGYRGKEQEDCECPISNEACIASNGVECNGFGYCDCGKCICNRDTFYRGQTCEDCTTCPGKCDANKECVQCMVFQSGPIPAGDPCRANCSHVKEVPILELNERKKPCRFPDDDGCFFNFVYYYDSNKVEAESTKQCPKPVNILAIILGIIGGIILIGLALLLIWKLLITINDRREFAKFEKERLNAKWDRVGNPIYKQATSTFKNPMYAGKS